MKFEVLKAVKMYMLVFSVVLTNSHDVITQKTNIDTPTQ
jgi:hypothetical protein